MKKPLSLSGDNLYGYGQIQLPLPANFDQVVAKTGSGPAQPAYVNLPPDYLRNSGQGYVAGRERENNYNSAAYFPEGMPFGFAAGQPIDYRRPAINSTLNAAAAAEGPQPINESDVSDIDFLTPRQNDLHGDLLNQNVDYTSKDFYGQPFTKTVKGLNESRDSFVSAADAQKQAESAAPFMLGAFGDQPASTTVPAELSPNEKEAQRIRAGEFAGNMALSLNPITGAGLAGYNIAGGIDNASKNIEQGHTRDALVNGAGILANLVLAGLPVAGAGRGAAREALAPAQSDLQVMRSMQPEAATAPSWVEAPQGLLRHEYEAMGARIKTNYDGTPVWGAGRWQEPPVTRQAPFDDPMNPYNFPREGPVWEVPGNGASAPLSLNGEASAKAANGSAGPIEAAATPEPKIPQYLQDQAASHKRLMDQFDEAENALKNSSLGFVPPVQGGGTGAGTTLGTFVGVPFGPLRDWAMNLRGAGATNREIFDQTGKVFGPEGALKQEISDAGASLKTPIWTPGIKTYGEVLEHPKLFAAQPELAGRDLEVASAPGASSSTGNGAYIDRVNIAPGANGWTDPLKDLIGMANYRSGVANNFAAGAGYTNGASSVSRTITALEKLRETQGRDGASREAADAVSNYLNYLYGVRADYVRGLQTGNPAESMLLAASGRRGVGEPGGAQIARDLEKGIYTNSAGGYETRITKKRMDRTEANLDYPYALGQLRNEPPFHQMVTVPNKDNLQPIDLLNFALNWNKYRGER